MNVYEIITNKIITELEKGSIPWQKPWSGGSGLAAVNLVSNKKYNGINTVLTNMQGYDCNLWGTFKQISSKGGKVNKGEKSTQIVFWKFLDTTDKTTGDAKQVPMLRYYNIFNIEQTDIEWQKPKAKKKTNFEVVATCENILSKMPLGMPKVVHQQQRACYYPEADYINMPKKETFVNSPSYYSTLFHEYSHSTGHSKRLKRSGIMERHHFGSCDYSKEELIAEISASFLNAEACILHHQIDNSVAYVKSWLNALRNDPKLIVTASGKAQKATDYILNKQKEA